MKDEFGEMEIYNLFIYKKNRPVSPVLLSSGYQLTYAFMYSEIILDRYVFLAEQIVLATKPAGKRTNCNIHNGIGFDPLQI